MWQMLSQLTENSDYHIKRDDQTTWKHFRTLMPLHSMLIKHWDWTKPICGISDKMKMLLMYFHIFGIRQKKNY